jgi:hypothetical protein
LGNNAARTDDIDCLDWNRKVPHILVTGSSSGFVTVWDVKNEKGESDIEQQVPEGCERSRVGPREGMLASPTWLFQDC